MPYVSAIVPARNEEANVESCVASLLRQDVNLEVLVANDGSTDRTAEIVSGMARNNSRVRLLEVPALPSGWVGKNHALAVAAREACGEWLLFTDADTVHLSGGLARALEQAEAYDLYSLSPEQETATWWEKAVIPLVYRELERLYSFDRINDPGYPAAAANGQYILIRRAGYEQVGGHTALAGEILEDVALARAVKRSGLRLRFGLGTGVVRTRMYRSFRAMWEGWSKNLFLLYGRKASPVWAAAARLLLLDLAPIPLALVWPAFWLAVLARHLWYWQRVRAWHALLLIPGSLMLLALLLNSRAKHRKGGAVVWKGREYASWST